MFRFPGVARVGAWIAVLVVFPACGPWGGAGRGESP